MQAGKSVILCASHRTGSTMVFQDFYNVLGCQPGHSEILSYAIVIDKAKRPWNEVWAEVSSRNKVEGYFVDKVMFHYTPLISSYIDRSSIAGAKSSFKFLPELFDKFYEFFSEAIWVHIQRRDVFAQAVSKHLAVTTQVWHRRNHEPLPADRAQYDRGKLRQYLQEFITEREQWQLFFQHYKIAPVRISYEDAVAGYPDYLAELLDKAGLRMVEKPLARRSLKLGDQVNETFVELLRKDVGADEKSRD